jgi:DNA-binding response OmpR family regulator
VKILLIEDHPGVAEISCRVLRELYGHEVRLATTGAEALKEAAAEVPDLVLVDLNLPDMSGYEVAQKLRGERRFDRTVVVAVTGFGSFVDDHHARQMGIDAHFRKPMDFEVLEDLKRAG